MKIVNKLAELYHEKFIKYWTSMEALRSSQKGKMEYH
jgi:hypothetical protein